MNRGAMIITAKATNLFERVENGSEGNGAMMYGMATALEPWRDFFR
jgi:hypothetical protein